MAYKYMMLDGISLKNGIKTCPRERLFCLKIDTDDDDTFIYFYQFTKMIHAL
jgi:hypothetical protein